MNRRLAAALVLIPVLIAGSAAAKDDSFAIIFNNTKNDGGFNESALKGTERFKAESGVSAREIVARSEEEATRALRTFAQNGIKNIVAISFTNEGPVGIVAKEFPAVHFTLIDGLVDLPNVRSVQFREDEAGYLAGVAAASATKAGKIGFVGGIPIPPIKKFECGYIQGALAVSTEIKVIRAYLGDQPTVFRDRDLGAKVGSEVVAKGADVVFAAAGYAGNGALESAANAGKLGIGVDTNQNGMFPGKILTSAVKRVDTAVYTAFKDGFDDKWTSGSLVLGLAREGVDWARDANNADLVKGFAPAVEKAAIDLASGAVKIEDPATAAVCR